LFPSRNVARHGHLDEAGYTLVEVLVTMTVMSLVVASVMGVLFSVQRGVERQVDLAERQTRAHQAVEAVDREVRSAEGFAVPAGGLELTIITLTNADTRGGESCAQFKVENGKLLKRYWIPPQTPADTVPFNIVATGIKTETCLSEDETCTFFVPTVANGGDPDDAYGGRLVKVNLTVEGEGDAPDQTVKQSLVGDNVPSVFVNPCDDAGEQPSS
jgi:prepilin-type N-terminal cleavage/methylation domain-containing protein